MGKLSESVRAPSWIYSLIHFSHQKKKKKLQNWGKKPRSNAKHAPLYIFNLCLSSISPRLSAKSPGIKGYLRLEKIYWCNLLFKCIHPATQPVKPKGIYSEYLPLRRCSLSAVWWYGYGWAPQFGRWLISKVFESLFQPLYFLLSPPPPRLSQLTLLHLRTTYITVTLAATVMRQLGHDFDTLRAKREKKSVCVWGWWWGWLFLLIWAASLVQSNLMMSTIR